MSIDRIATVRPVDEHKATGKVAAIFADIKRTKDIDFVPAFWRTIATNPAQLELVWTSLKTLMHPEAVDRGSRLDPKTREIIALTVSARDNTGLDELWDKIEERHAAAEASGALAARRKDQAVAWMREIFEQRLLAAFKGGRRVSRLWGEIEEKVRSGEITPPAAVDQLAKLMGWHEQ